ncbi:MAG TPA: glutathione peroxidase [Ignavibacteriaceae bacterium]|nr:glutathione peroxidase [Ignavibacteriaceae bacterium]
MKQFFFSLPVLLLFGFLSYGFLNMNNISIQQTKGDDEVNKSIYNFSVKDIDGKEIQLSDYKGKVLLIVNVASRCGFTKQYNGLEEIYRKYKERGFEILAFPCNDFGNQEPGTNEEIKEFCSSKFDVSFQLFDKVKVLGDDKEPLYAFLTDNPVTGKSDIGWNFEKFIVDREGNIVKRLKSNVDPLSEILITVLEEELQK